MGFLDLIKAAIQTEAKAVTDLVTHVNWAYAEAINCILDCKGKVVVTGVGKSGLIGKKIAATLSSTGQPSFFVHSADAVHGDSGMIEKKDVVILISNSGETKETLDILPIIDRVGSKKIAITSDVNSTLAKASDVALTYSYEREADHLNLAPTTSSTLVLVIGDALAVTLSQIREFDREAFYLYHPGGSLGERISSVADRKEME